MGLYSSLQRDQGSYKADEVGIMTQVEQAMAMIVILLGVAGAAVILVVTVWVILFFAVRIRRLTRELR